MANLRTARRNIYAIAIVLVAIDIAAAIVLISPAGAASQEARLDEFRAVRGDVQKKMRTVVPPDQVQNRVGEARKQIVDFIDQRIPAEGSAVPVELGKLAADSGVQLSSAHYSVNDSEIAGVQQVNVTASIAGNYLQIVKFINAVERARTFFVINSISLGEEQAGGVRLTLNLDAYLREEQP